jgi:uncharacterized protein YprB with RNaseH-like and TPR domain
MLSLFICSQAVTPLLNIVLRSHQLVQDMVGGKDHGLTILHFSASEWSKIKKIRPHEIEFNGKLFDIDFIKHIHKDVYLRGHFDDK